MRLRSSEMPPLGALIWPFQRGAGAERDDRRAVPGAQLDDRLHLLGRFGEHHGVGQVGLVIGDVLAVLFAHACAVVSRSP
jgi:D-serine deaminase-like pyridoxal phosphate-dependent protein